MKWFGHRSQATDFAEAIRPELQQLSVPAPSAELLDRIVASRQSGARVILPEVSDVHVNARRRLLIPAALVAALLLIALPFRLPPPREAAGSEASSLARIATEWLPGSVAFAQSDATRAARSAAPMSFSRPGNLRPMRLEYLRTWRDSSRKEIGRVNGVITVQRAMSDGTPAWLVVSRNNGSRNGRTVFSIDSTFMSRENLGMLSHTAIERPYSRYDEIRIDQRFRGDSILGRMQAKGTKMSAATRPIARKLSTAYGPYIVDGVGPIILGAVNLREGWSGRASLVGWAVRDEDVFMPMELRVDGAEMIVVPAGRFDCWKLTLHFGTRSVTFWSRKSDGVGIRSVERDATGITRETVLK